MYEQIMAITSIDDLRDFLENASGLTKNKKIVYCGELVDNNYFASLKNFDLLLEMKFNVENFHILLSEKSLDIFTFLSPLCEFGDSIITMADCASIDKIKNHIICEFENIIGNIVEDDIPDELMIGEYARYYYAVEFLNFFSNKYGSSEMFKEGILEQVKTGSYLNSELYIFLREMFCEQIGEFEMTEKTPLIYYCLIQMYGHIYEFLNQTLPIFIMSELFLVDDGIVYKNLNFERFCRLDFLCDVEKFSNVEMIFQRLKYKYTNIREKFNETTVELDYDSEYDDDDDIRVKCYEELFISIKNLGNLYLSPRKICNYENTWSRVLA